MLDQFFLAWGWGAFIFLALAGWGWCIGSVSSKKQYSFGMFGVLGVAFTIAVGGFLNLYSAISPVSIKLYVLTGLVLFILYVWNNFAQIINGIKNTFSFLVSDKKFTAFVLLLLAFFCARIILSSSFYGFHGADDDQGYLVFSQKMIQTGELGADPFSERRLVSSLGGKYFLDSFILAVSDYKYLHMVDNCISYIFFIFLIYGLLVTAQLNKYIKLLLLGVILIIPSPSGNVTSVITSMLLFAGILSMVIEFKKSNWESFVLFPLVVASAIASKSNMIIPVVVVAALYYILLSKDEVGGIKSFSVKVFLVKAVKNFAVPCGVVLGLLLPWMLSMYHSSNTLLYPILGRGYHGTSYGTFLSHYFSFDVYSFIRLAFEGYGALSLVLPLVILCVIVTTNSFPQKKILLWVMFPGFLGMAALIYATGGYSLYYYSFSFILPIVIMCLVSINKNSTIDKLKIATITFVLLSFMSGFYVQRGFDVFQEIKNGVSFEKGFSFGFFTSNPTTQETRELYKNLQEVVPPHETMLVALDKNFILNFKRNQVYIMDSPGAASFPPGLPMFRGEDELSKYLLSKNIKYLACSCGEKASFSKSFIAGMLKVHVNPWLKTETTNLIDFHDSFQLLAKEKKVLYDDGANIVLDISLNH